MSDLCDRPRTFSQTLRKILALDRIVIAGKMPSKKKTLEQIAITTANSVELSVHDIFDGLIKRERLGTTALGQGLAIPHCRLPIFNPIGCFMLLREGVNFEADDDINVDMLFALFVPIETNEEHLEILADIASIFRQPNICQQFRAATHAEELFQRLMHV